MTICMGERNGTVVSKQGLKYSETSDNSTPRCFQNSNISISNAETGFVL